MTQATLSAGDTGWVLVSSALVLLMTVGLAFFYGGLSPSPPWAHSGSSNSLR